MPTVMKMVKKISKQEENESRRLAAQFFFLFSLQLSYLLNVLIVFFTAVAQIMERCYD